MNALRTLIVEDDAMIAGLLAETLEGLGHGVCAVETNVARAVAAASRWRPDLMIVDVGLGEASGIAAVKEILSSSFVPYVFVTGSALSGLSMGPDTVLIRKPFRVSDLDQAIQTALSAASACDRVATKTAKEASTENTIAGPSPDWSLPFGPVGSIDAGGRRGRSGTRSPRGARS
jgi:two-component system, response regulator PdtaR